MIAKQESAIWAAKYFATSGKGEYEMSRIGKTPISIPTRVEIAIDGANVEVKGPKGILNQVLPEGISITH